jgi:uncharacterized OsmC-like protein
VTEPAPDICECFPALREVTLAREQRYRDDPSRPAPEGPQSTVEVRVVSTGNLDDRAESLKSGRSWPISEPRHVGGLASAPTPLEYLLSGVLGCFAAVYAFYAAKLGVDYTGFEVRAIARFDARGHMMPDAPSSAFRSVELDVHVTSAAPTDELQRLLDLALAGCPGISTLRDPVPVAARLLRNG